MAHKIREIGDTNRIMRLKPVRTFYYCNYCDRDMVEPGRKCGTCGHKSEIRRLRK